jgi:glycosyltransferase involved in cell wall biosynthesis
VKVSIGVLTHNQFSTGRHELFLQTLRSLKGAGWPFDLFVVDNGSTDQSGEYVQSIGGTAIKAIVSTCGFGMNATARACLSTQPDMVVLSNDDIEWHEGFLEVLVDFWDAAPLDVLIASGILEPDYPWNTARELLQAGPTKALVRDTAPGGAWSFRASDWLRIGPVPESAGWDDVPTCQRLKAEGYRVCQLDLAEHIGEGYSSWGNISHTVAKPLDRAKWGI